MQSVISALFISGREITEKISLAGTAHDLYRRGSLYGEEIGCFFSFYFNQYWVSSYCTLHLAIGHNPSLSHQFY